MSAEHLANPEYTDRFFGYPSTELTKPELVEAFKLYSQDEATFAVDGVLGVISYRHAIDEVRGFASIDLDEVVRDTHDAMAQTVGKGRHEIAHFGRYYETLGVDAGDEQAMVIERMNAAPIKPVADIADIKAILQNLRKKEVAVIANTSTLPGCEAATIRFITDELKGCFDGIVFPRDIYRNGTGHTKATALEAVLSQKNMWNNEPLRIFHVDDLPHHVEIMRAHQKHYPIREFLGAIPEYPGHSYPTDTQKIKVVPTPLDAFEVGSEFLLGRRRR